MKKLSLNFLIGCLIGGILPHLSAQTSPKSSILGNSVDWQAMMDLTLPADPLWPDEHDMASMGVLKLGVEQNLWFDAAPAHTLNLKLWEIAKSGQWPLFLDPELQAPIAFETAIGYLSRLDTIVTFDPQTYEETIEIKEFKQLPVDAPYVKVRQVLTYEHVGANFSIKTTAIGPCFDNGFVPYWMAVPDADWNVLPAEEDITWAVRYVTHATSPGPEKWQEIKNTTGPILERLVDRLRGDSSIVLYDPEIGKPLFGRDRECLFACVQQIEVFDPQTNTEYHQETMSGIDQEQVTELQLMEEWFWDAAQQKLFTRLVAVAPRFWVLETEAGKQTFPKILFYHRSKW